MAADEADAKLQSFLQWLQANGADLRDCTIRACGDKGFGVFSTAPEPGATDGNTLPPEESNKVLVLVHPGADMRVAALVLGW
ncbi:hypothetical protein EJB05_46586, partial [Eragrostis curvula]